MPATQPIPISPQQLFSVGCVFGGLLIVFFIAAFFYRGLDRGQWQILRTLGALCAGFCGGLFTGTALFQLTGEYNGLNLGISGAAGFAGFFTVWFTWPNYEQVVLQPDIATSIPSGFTFEKAVRHLADAKSITIAFEGFDDKAKSAEIHPVILSTSLPNALSRLRLFAIHPEAIPEYNVVIEDSKFYKMVATMGKELVMGRNVCQCPQPPGGQADCEAHQMAICWVEDGRAKTRCIDPPRGVASIELSNFILERVTGVKRQSKQQLSADDVMILKTGQYEDSSRDLRVTFRMPK